MKLFFFYFHSLFFFHMALFITGFKPGSVSVVMKEKKKDWEYVVNTDCLHFQTCLVMEFADGGSLYDGETAYPYAPQFRHDALL